MNSAGVRGVDLGEAEKGMDGEGPMERRDPQRMPGERGPSGRELVPSNPVISQGPLKS
jgi:hypothetical protein